MVEPPAHLTGTTRELFPDVYQQLRALAQKKLAHEPRGLTLQATALVHEVFLRLSNDPQVSWENPRQFFAVAAEAMRRILVERARKYSSRKHGGGRLRLGLELGEVSIEGSDPTIMLSLDSALEELRDFDPRLCEVVMLRYFAGLSIDETAAAMHTSPRTVKRDWQFARAWLARKLRSAAE
ncbi:MAG: ECF-type sigma factor [Phycisphaerae bacterium]|nr:ECF-type sigma factor [Phycisphaerae bacterium]MDW8261491.1 ECF-type sigma factor [Phycisphaerales bacterium]